MAGVGRGGPSAKNWGGDMHAEVTSEVPEETAQAQMEIDDSEPYQREMSPMTFDLTRLPPEERQLEIIDEMEDRRRLVRSLMPSSLRNPVDICPPHCSLPRVGLLLRLASYQSLPNPPKVETLLHQAELTWNRKRFTVHRQRKIWTRTRKSSTWKR